MQNNGETRQLCLENVIRRGLMFYPDQVQNLATILNLEKEFNDGISDVKISSFTSKIVKNLEYYGSNDIAWALRGKKGVDYSEIVYDVGKFLKAKVNKNVAVELNEMAIIKKLTSELITKMTEAQLHEFSQTVFVDDNANLELLQQKLLTLVTSPNQFMFFNIVSLTANIILKQILGKSALPKWLNPSLVGLSLASIALDFIAGPAYRKTIPAVCQIIFLRQLILRHCLIGIVGDGSTGKDAALTTIFGLNGISHPIAGSTAKLELYSLANANLTVANFAGFNDYRAEVEEVTDDLVEQMDAFIMVADVNRFTKTDIEIYQKLQNIATKRGILVCCNKADLVKDENSLAELMTDIRVNKIPEVHGDNILVTSLDPHPNLTTEKRGVNEVRAWVEKILRQHQKCSEYSNYFSNLNTGENNNE